MYWLRRPPYLRWVAAGLILLAGLAFELRSPAMEAYPFAAVTIDPGTPVADNLAWRDVPVGLLPDWPGPVAGTAATAIAPGDPVLPSAVAEIPVPSDWWAIPLAVPAAIAPGSRLRAVLADNVVVEGVVVAAGIDTGFEPTAMVAFAPNDAPQVARAAASDAIVVMVAVTGDPIPPTD